MLISSFFNKNCVRLSVRIIMGIVFFDVALLYELGWDKFFDCVVLADVDYETQRLRVMARDKISAEDFDKINKLQMSRDENTEV